MSRLPQPCGPLSEGVVRALQARPDGPHAIQAGAEPRAMGDVEYPLTDRDFQLALWILYELHYRGFDEVDPAVEWDPLLIVSRAALERTFEHAVRTFVGPVEVPDDDIARALVKVTASAGPSEVARFLHRRATRAEFCSYLRQRAVYHLRESDPQSFVLPRLSGAAKTALAELQNDEYGAGEPDRQHQHLFAQALTSLDLTTDLTTYVEEAEGATLASVNVMSLFALNRRLRGAAMGHLAAFEATSSLPCDRVLRGARRLRLPDEVAAYYDEHVEADAVHEQLAIRGICARLAEDEPDLVEDILLGALACLAVDGLAGDVLLQGWQAQRAERTGRAAG